MKLKSILLAAGSLLGATLVSAQGSASAYPVKPITLVVPATAGGLTDNLARAIADEMSKRMGQPILIDNKAGASGMVGTQAVARAAPDGYTVLFTGPTPVVNAPLMHKTMPYDVRRDLAFVTKVFSGQVLLSVNAKNVPATDVRSFVEWVRNNKGRINYGSHGDGTVGHFVGSSLSQSQKLDMVHVPYRGEAPMVQDLIGGQITSGVSSVGIALQHLETGKLRALAVIGDRRAADLPDVPTMAEAGFPEPEFNMSSWVGMFAPAGTPPAVLDKLQKEVKAALQVTGVKARLQVYGMYPVGSTGAEFRREYDNTIMPTYERTLKAAGIKPQ